MRKQRSKKKKSNDLKCSKCGGPGRIEVEIFQSYTFRNLICFWCHQTTYVFPDEICVEIVELREIKDDKDPLQEEIRVYTSYPYYGSYEEAWEDWKEDWGHTIPPTPLERIDILDENE